MLLEMVLMMQVYAVEVVMANMVLVMNEMALAVLLYVIVMVVLNIVLLVMEMVLMVQHYAFEVMVLVNMILEIKDMVLLVLVDELEILSGDILPVVVIFSLEGVLLDIMVNHLMANAFVRVYVNAPLTVLLNIVVLLRENENRILLLVLVL